MLTHGLYSQFAVHFCLKHVLINVKNIPIMFLYVRMILKFHQ